MLEKLREKLILDVVNVRQLKSFLGALEREYLRFDKFLLCFARGNLYSVFLGPLCSKTCDVRSYICNKRRITLWFYIRLLYPIFWSKWVRADLEKTCAGKRHLKERAISQEKQRLEMWVNLKLTARIGIENSIIHHRSLRINMHTSVREQRNRLLNND